MQKTSMLTLAVTLLGAGGCEPAPTAATRDLPGPDASRAPQPADAVRFAPGIVSTDREEYRITFTPDGRTAYFGRADAFFPVSRQAWIYETHLVRGQWTEPVVASFSGVYSDIDPFVSPDGRRLFFASIRPVGGVSRADADVWMVERAGDGWGEPVNLGPAVNSPNDELYPSVDARGNLFVGSTRAHAPDQPRKWNIWRFELQRGVYAAGERLGPGVNSDHPAHWEFNPAVSPDGHTLVFTRLNLADQVGTGFGEIHASRLQRGEWQPARNVGAPVNSGLDEFHPSFSASGATLFFARRDPLAGPAAQGDLFSVPVRALGDALR